MATTQDAFDQLYQQPQLKAILPCKYTARGLMTAIGAAPEIPLPERWMPWFIRHRETALSEQQVDKLAEHLMYCLRDTLDAMRQEQVLLPAGLISGDMPGADLQAWLKGLLQGHQQVESLWQHAWDRARNAPEQDQGLDQEDPARRLQRCLKLFSTLADVEAACQVRSASQARTLRQHIPQLMRQLPGMVGEYVTLAGELAAFLPHQFEMYQDKPKV